MSEENLFEKYKIGQLCLLEGDSFEARRLKFVALANLLLIVTSYGKSKIKNLFEIRKSVLSEIFTRLTFDVGDEIVELCREMNSSNQRIKNEELLQSSDGLGVFPWEEKRSMLIILRREKKKLLLTLR